MFRTISTPFAAAVFLLLASSSHAQQSRPERPYRGLFGGGDAESQQGLTVSGSIGGGYDTNLAEDARDATQLSVPGTELRRSGTLGQFSGSVSYALARETAAFSASAGTTGRYYPSGNHRRIVRRDSAGLQGSTRIGAGVSVYGSAGYSPYRVSDLYAALLVPTAGVASDDFDFGTSAEHFFSYSGGASGGWPLSRRVSVDATYGYGGRAASSRIPGYSSHRAGGGLRYNIGRGLDLNLGYTYAQARYASQESYESHAINAGVDFRRALSLSRRTTLRFSTGTAAMSDPARRDGLRYRFIGDIALNHEIGRTWLASVSYSRGLRFSETWTSPIFSDAVTVSFGGLATRRLTVHSAAGGSTGRVGTGTGGGFDTYFADAGMTYALGRHATVGTSYRYHHHDFADALSVAPGIGSLLDRHSVQVYLSVWAPVFSQRARRP